MGLSGVLDFRGFTGVSSLSNMDCVRLRIVSLGISHNIFLLHFDVESHTN